MQTVKALFGWVLLCCIQHSALAQDSTAKAVRWTYAGAGKMGNDLLFSFKASLGPGWKLFSVSMPDELPNTRVQLDTPTLARIIGIEEKGILKHHPDSLFGGAEIRWLEKSAELLVSVDPGPGNQPIRGNLNFMAIRGNEVVGPEAVPFRFRLDGTGNPVAESAALQHSLAGGRELRRSTIDLSHPVNSCGGTGGENSRSAGLWTLFGLGFLGGLIAILTPCVFPMIPLTVSFFTKQSGPRRKGVYHALRYGFFILLIYVLLSLPFYFLGSVDPGIFNSISTNIWLNLFFFVVFVVFALSFFGLFEIQLPSGIANAAGARAGLGGWVGIFFMALTLALVSFSCTGPILGSLLAGSLTSSGGALQLTAGMTGFGLALALPFTLFALFPGWLHSLPQSGSWLHSVKIVLGFLEIALAIKFLSNADLVAHWGILKREVFIGVWMIIGILLFLYLIGVLRLGDEGTARRPRPWKLTLALACLAFIIYLAPGLSNGPRSNISVSGMLPPFNYSLYGSHSAISVEAQVVNDYSKALALSQRLHKPLLVDFTGWACVNCRKMEANVWPRPEVRDLIEKDFVLVSLYVDDRKKLPEGEPFLYATRDGGSKPILTVGDKYATLQSENFVNASQPLYVILSPDERLMNLPIGYTPDPHEYASWLRCGLNAFGQSSR